MRDSLTNVCCLCVNPSCATRSHRYVAATTFQSPSFCFRLANAVADYRGPIFRTNQVGIDLLQGLSAYVSKDEADPTGHPAPLAPFLDAIWHFQVGAAADKRPHFVTFRNNMNKIMGVRVRLSFGSRSASGVVSIVNFGAII